MTTNKSLVKSSTGEKCTGKIITTSAHSGGYNDNDSVTSSPFPPETSVVDSVNTATITTNRTGDDSLKGRKFTNSSLKKTSDSLKLSKNISLEKVSLINHTATSLFKPGSSNKSLDKMFHHHQQQVSPSKVHKSPNLVSSIEEETLVGVKEGDKKTLENNNNNSQVPPWYLHYLANVMSNDSSSAALVGRVSMSMTYDDVKQLKSLYESCMKTQEDLFTSPSTHFQPIRQDYYERPCNLVTDSSMVGMVPCSRNCPNHERRRKAKKINDNITPQCESLNGPAQYNLAGSSSVTFNNDNSGLTVLVTSPLNPSHLATSLTNCTTIARPMSESREELASFIGPFSPVDSTHSQSDYSKEYKDDVVSLSETTAVVPCSSRGLQLPSDDSSSIPACPSPSQNITVSGYSSSCAAEPIPCHGKACSSVSFNSQGKIVNHQLTTLSVATASTSNVTTTTAAHASMTYSNGDIEVPSKCSNFDGKNASTTEGKSSIEVVTDGESGTNNKSNHLLLPHNCKIESTLTSNCNCESSEMIIDAQTHNKDNSSINISPKNRPYLLNQATFTNHRPQYTRKMNHSTGKSSKVVIEEIESDDEITILDHPSSGQEFAMVTTTTNEEAISTVSIEDAIINRPDSPADDYDAICSIVNDVLKSNQIVIEEGNYEDELKLLPSDLRNRHQQYFNRGQIDNGQVSSSNFLPTNNHNNLDWSIDSPHNWSMFSSSKFSSSNTSSPSLNESPLRTNNVVSSTTAFTLSQEASSTSNTSTFDSYEYAIRDTYSNNRNSLNKSNNVDIAIFTDGSSNSSNSSSGTFSTLNQEQQHQYSHVSSTVTQSDNRVTSSSHIAYGTSAGSSSSSSAAPYNNPYYDCNVDVDTYLNSNNCYVEDEYPCVTGVSSLLRKETSSLTASINSSNRQNVSLIKSSCNPGATLFPSNSNKNNRNVGNEVNSLNNRNDHQTSLAREKSSSPTVYQVEPRLEKVTAFSSKPCTFFLEGNCRKSDCKYSHDLSTITCKFWKEGFCFKGDSCPFAHDDLDFNSHYVDGNILDVNEIGEEEKHVFTIDSEADFPSLADEKDPRHPGSNNLPSCSSSSSSSSFNDANSKGISNKRSSCHKVSSSKGFTAVASILNPVTSSSSFLSSSQPASSHGSSNVLFINKSQSSGKGKKKKRAALKAI